DGVRAPQRPPEGRTRLDAARRGEQVPAIDTVCSGALDHSRTSIHGRSCMKVLTYGEIMDGGLNVFHSVAKLDDENRLVLTFEGVIRIDNPYRYLSGYLDELARLLPQQSIADTTMDFVKMRFCNSNGFYVIMDIVDTVYNLVPGP